MFDGKFRARTRRSPGMRAASASAALAVALLLAGQTARALDLDRGSDVEGQTVMEVEVLGCVSTSPDQIRYRMTVKKGQPYRQREADGDYQRLLATNLFADVMISRPRVVPGGVTLTVSVRERDLVRRIEIRGNRQLKEKRLRKAIKTRIGDRFDIGKANADRRAIEEDYQKEFYYFASCSFETEPFEDGVRLVFNIDEGGGRVYVAEVNFRGNVAMSRKELLARMQTRPSGIFTRGKYIREQFDKDLEILRLFYRSKGYLDVVIAERPFKLTTNTADSRWKRRDVYINIDIDEGRQYRVGRIDIEGNNLVDDELIRRTIKTMPGQVFDPAQLAEDAKAVRDVYGLYPNSRYFSKVETSHSYTEEGAVIDVSFHIEEGPEAILSSIRIHGLKYTREEVVLREFNLFPGQKVDSRKWNTTVRNIRRLGYFRETSPIELKQENSPGRGIATLELEEQQTGRLNFGVGYSSTDKLVGSIGLTQRNFDFTDMPKSFKDFITGQCFRGAGQEFNARMSRGTKGQNYNLGFMNPWIFGKPVSFSIDAFYNEYEYDDEYDELRTGVQLGLGKRLFGIPDLRGSIAYRLEKVRLSEFKSEATDEMKKDEGDAWLNRWILNVTYDTRDNYIQPTRGMLLSGTYELAGSPAGGDHDFWRAFVQAQFFMTTFVDKQELPWVLALRFDYRAADVYGDDTRLPLSERFHAGGVGSVRGFRSRTISPRDSKGNIVGGSESLVAGAEFFVPVYEKLIQASAFFDMGNVWANSSITGVGITGEGWRRAWGVGVHIKTPLGPMPIRLYYSVISGDKPDDEEQLFQFSLGTVFG